MTTVPGHNQIIQQSGIAREISQQDHLLRPSPDQAAVLQQARDIRKKSTVLSSEESERLKKEKQERENRQKRRRQEEEEHEQPRQAGGTKKAAHAGRQQARDMDPDAPGQILDTTV